MYSRKITEPRVEPWGTPALTGYTREDLPSRTTRRKPACQTLSKALDISSATARVAPGLLKAPALLKDTIVRRSAVDWEDLKPYWKSESRPHFSRWSTILPVGIYLLRVNNRNTRTSCEICSKLTIKTPERRQCRLNIFHTLFKCFYC